MDIVFVVYADWGSHDGCMPPFAVFSSKEKAALYIFENAGYRREQARIKEFKIDRPSTPEPNETPVSGL